MAEITNAAAVRFARRAHRLAELVRSMDRTLDEAALLVVSEFEANTGANANEDVIIDGAENPMTKDDVADVKYVFEQLKVCLNVDDRRAVISKWCTSGGRPIF